MDGLKLVWQVSIAFSVLGFVLAFLVKSLTLRDELNTEYGLEEKDTSKEKSSEEGNAS
jgi:hypothetical protein